jgi:hypothetical protein
MKDRIFVWVIFTPAIIYLGCIIEMVEPASYGCFPYLLIATTSTTSPRMMRGDHPGNGEYPSGSLMNISMFVASCC